MPKPPPRAKVEPPNLSAIELVASTFVQMDEDDTPLTPRAIATALRKTLRDLQGGPRSAREINTTHGRRVSRAKALLYERDRPRAPGERPPRPKMSAAEEKAFAEDMARDS